MSTFTWIDHSEKQRRQILEAIDLFREKDTRDELPGVADSVGCVAQLLERYFDRFDRIRPIEFGRLIF